MEKSAPLPNQGKEGYIIKRAGGWIPFFVAVLTLKLTLAIANEPANREWARVQAQHALASDQPADAIEILKEHVNSDPTDFEAWNLLGLVQTQTGAFEDAIHSFTEALNSPTSEKTPIYRYNLADAFSRLGKVTKAREALTDVYKNELYRDQAYRAFQILQPKRPLPPLRLQAAPPPSESHDWTGVLIAGGGYDTNVSVSNDRELLAGVSTISPVLRLGGLARYSRAMQSELNLQASTMLSYPTHSSVRNLSSLTMQAEVNWRSRPWQNSFDHFFVTTISDQFGLSYLDLTHPSLFNWQNSFMGSGDFGISDTFALSPSVGFRYQGYPPIASSPSGTDRTGLAPAAGINLKYIKNDIKLTIGSFYERLGARDSAWNSTQILFPVRLETPLPWNAAGKAEFSWGNTNYPNYPNSRNDHPLQFGYSIIRRVGTQGMLMLQYELNKATSTYDLAAYTRHTFFTMIGYAF